MLSNPTGGPEQSKRAAQQLSDANSEIPKALAGGAQKVRRHPQQWTCRCASLVAAAPRACHTAGSNTFPSVSRCRAAGMLWRCAAVFPQATFGVPCRPRRL